MTESTGKMRDWIIALTEHDFSWKRVQGLDILDEIEREIAERACDEKSYDAGFDNGMKAVLQQLDGLIHEGADVDEIQGWIDRQWEEEI